MAHLLGPDDIDVAAAALAAGQLVAFPTETVYGLGADAGSATAVARVFEAKGRPTGHPLIVHMADAGGLDRFGRRVDQRARALADAFWPGPLTIVVPRGEAVDPATTGGRDTVGLRVPDHPVALALLAVFGGGVAAPSANRFGSVSPTTAAHVMDELGPVVEVVIDGGPSTVGVESTIVDLTAGPPTLLRPGGISAVEIEAALGVELVDGRAGESRAPGMLVSHYAPRVPVELVTGGTARAAADRAITRAGASGDRVGLLAPFATDRCPSFRLPADAAGYAAGLYARLREADGAGLDRLLVVPPVGGPLLDAVLDRLTKAAAPR